jgi:hypothetical protein
MLIKHNVLTLGLTDIIRILKKEWRGKYVTCPVAAHHSMCKLMTSLKSFISIFEIGISVI